MDDDDIIVEGATIVSTNVQPSPYNPLNRPPIHFKKPILVCSAFLICVLTVAFAAVCVHPLLWYAEIAVVVLFGILFLKRAVIWCIHLYQNKASDKTRLRCVFEPSCSEYMILAIQKYGLIRGLIKGCDRLDRCHAPNGGKDYP